jgi:hypothetical protein
MASAESIAFAQRAKRVYAERLQAQLEATHRGQFVAVEPESGDYFLGRTPTEATLAARQAHPDRLTFLIRIGFSAAFEIGYGET